jgi:hypothetical protein
MCTNIDSASGVAALRKLIYTNKNSIPTEFPSELFLEILEFVMDNNIFSFADSYWLHLSRTAMGTPAACSYATLSFGQYENKVLLPAFKGNLIFYCCYIDDVFGIWLPSTTNNDNTWSDLKQTLNNWGNLKWSLEEPSRKTNFLDLNIAIKHPNLHFSTFRSHSIFTYIFPRSPHISRAA